MSIIVKDHKSKMPFNIELFGGVELVCGLYCVVTCSQNVLCSNQKYYQYYYYYFIITSITKIIKIKPFIMLLECLFTYSAFETKINTD